MQSLRLLFLLPFPPRLDAKHGGGQVIGQLLEELSRRHRIAVLYLRAPHEHAVDAFFLSRCEHLQEIFRPWAGLAPRQQVWRIFRLLKGLLLGRPYWVTDWYSPLYQQHLNGFIQLWQPDIIQIENHIMGQYLPGIGESSAPKVLVVHEPGISASSYIKGGPVFLKTFSHSLDRRNWQRYEERLYPQPDCVTVFTRRDEKTLEKMAVAGNVRRIPPGIRIPEKPLNPLGEEPPTLLFIGNFIHSPNLEAAQRLINSIFPLILTHIPNARLLIVGPEPPKSFIKNPHPQVQVTGPVNDITLYLDRAAIFIAPLFSGGGIRIKVLEALAAGKAIVATPLAAEGLELEAGLHLALAEDDQGLSACAIELLENPVRRGQMAEQARQWACRNLNWDQAVSLYERLYGYLIEGKQRA